MLSGTSVQRMELVNALLEHDEKSYGDVFLENFNVAVRAQRGADCEDARAERRVLALLGQ